jgi:hypothetical protein
VLVLSIASSCGLPGDISRDTTAPTFIQIRVVYQRVSDGLEVGSEVIPSTGFSRANLARDRRIILGVSVADNESGVQSVWIDGSGQWSCITPGAERGGLQQDITLPKQSDEERNGTAATGTPKIRNAHFTIDPLSDYNNRLACSPSDDETEFDVRVTIRARNGKGLEVASASITFTYLRRPAIP